MSFESSQSKRKEHSILPVSFVAHSSPVVYLPSWQRRDGMMGDCCWCVAACHHIPCLRHSLMDAWFMACQPLPVQRRGSRHPLTAGRVALFDAFRSLRHNLCDVRRRTLRSLIKPRGRLRALLPPASRREFYYYYLLLAYIIAQSTAQGHLRALHKFKFRTPSWTQYKACKLHKRKTYTPNPKDIVPSVSLW